MKINHVFVVYSLLKRIARDAHLGESFLLKPCTIVYQRKQDIWLCRFTLHMWWSDVPYCRYLRVVWKAKTILL